MKAKFDTSLKFFKISLSMTAFWMIGDSIASFKFSGMWKVSKDKFIILVMTGNSGPIYSFLQQKLCMLILTRLCSKNGGIGSDV